MSITLRNIQVDQPVLRALLAASTGTVTLLARASSVTAWGIAAFVGLCRVTISLALLSAAGRLARGRHGVGRA